MLENAGSAAKSAKMSATREELAGETPNIWIIDALFKGQLAVDQRNLVSKQMANNRGKRSFVT